ncbi:AAA family ATPase [Marinomonas polaris]|uniref:AAA family ATPase n=1 Tax=Marinomonas polaris TaxID=293552 RepID=UPI003F9A140E
MQLVITGNQPHKGFMLSEEFHHHGNLVVLTGRNGSGKTRLLESISNKHSKALIGDELSENNKITYLEQSKLTPNFGGGYDDAKFQNMVVATLKYYATIKNTFDAPLDLNNMRRMGGMSDGAMAYDKLYLLCNNIADHLSKPASQLTDEEIIFYFEESANNVLGIQNVSSIVNNYIKRNKKNRFNRYCSEQEGEDVPFLTDQEFLKKFGEEPWVLLNNIIKTTFDGKFLLSEPDVKSGTYSYRAILTQKEDNAPIDISALSSGERTLMWLALTLFNTQYYEGSSVNSPTLLLLDEPDAFLHPKMVIKMYQTLEAFSSNFKTQIILTTHSPTTVALAPESSTYVVRDNKVSSVSKDEGIAELLDGVTQISISAENRRQVFVESLYDADIYQAIYSKIAHQSKMIDPKISLNFVSSGPKMPKQTLIDKVRQVFDIRDDVLIDNFIDMVNGVGNCVQVIGHVESLTKDGSDTVRGIIDWNRKNPPTNNVCVLAPDYAYSTENIILDPICIFLMLHIHDEDAYPMERICGFSVNWMDWLNRPDLLQVSVDNFILEVLGRNNRKDSKLSYFSGLELYSDSEYLQMDGHPMEKKLKEIYPKLNHFSRSGKDGELKFAIVKKAMIQYTDGKFIPSSFEKVISEVQK